MAVHKLSLEIPDTLNKCILRIVDTSVYNEDISIKCPKLQISVPGFSQSYFMDDVVSGFSFNLTACNLKIQVSGCGVDFNDLPDKVYVIGYSVSPNDKVYVEYNHMRITKALNRIRDLYCKLDLGACEPGPEMKKKLNEISFIQQLLSAAKAKAEECKQVKQGIALYNYACELLSKQEGCCK